VDDQARSSRTHFSKGKLHQPDLSKKEDLKLLSDICHGQKFGCAEMTAASVVNYHIEVAGFAERLHEYRVNLSAITQIKLHRVKMFMLRQAFQIPRCPPYFVASFQESLGNGEPDSGAGAG